MRQKKWTKEICSGYKRIKRSLKEGEKEACVRDEHSGKSGEKTFEVDEEFYGKHGSKDGDQGV